MLLIGGSVSASEQPDYNRRIDRIATIANDYAGFNGTVLVANSDGIIYQKSFGFADKDKTVTLTPEHRFSPGSIDKEFTTAALMLLEQQGRLGYGDRLSKYLPQLPPWAATVSIEHILTHTSGLPDIKYGRNLTTAAAIEQIMAVQKLNSKPGEEFQYGNLHSVLRTMVIENISGQSQDVFIKQNIFAPAGMDSAFSKTDPASKPPMMAYGDLPMTVAGIDMYVTALDLYKWEKALWNGDIVSKKSLTAALVPHKESGDSDRAYFDFGGFTTNEDGAVAEVYHDGTHPSHFALQSINFDTGLIVVLLSSDGNKSTLDPLKQAIVALADSPSVQIPDAWWLENERRLHGLPAALETLKSAIRSGERLTPKEPVLNSMGYALSGTGTIEDALAVLKLNVQFYPNSANAHDSYADNLLKAKEYSEAERIAERGLALAKKEGNGFLIRSMSGYLKKIQAIKQP